MERDYEERFGRLHFSLPVLKDTFVDSLYKTLLKRLQFFMGRIGKLILTRTKIDWPARIRLRRLGKVLTALLYCNNTMASPPGHFQTSLCAESTLYLALLEARIHLVGLFQCSRYPREMGMVSKCRADDSVAIGGRIGMIGPHRTTRLGWV